MKSSEKRQRRTFAHPILTVLLVFACCTSHCLPSWAAPKITQLAHSAWRVQEGNIAAAVETIAQTADGYLWIGTESGLFRFDGARFTHWTPPDGQTIDPRIYALLGDPDGSLWIGTASGLYHLSGNTLAYVVGGRSIWLHKDPAGGIWFTRLMHQAHDSGFCHIVELRATCIAPRGASNVGVSVVPDPVKGYWFVDLGGDLIYESGAESRLVVDVKRGHALEVMARIAAPGNRGAVVVSMSRKAGPPYIRIYQNGGFSDFPLPADVDASTLINAIVVDADGSIWAGTSNRGLYHLSTTGIEHFDKRDGLSSDSISYIFRDREGTLWVATSGGLDSFHRFAVETWSRSEGLTSDQVSAVVVDHANRVWFSSYSGLDLLENGKVSSIRAGAGLPGKKPGSMLVDSRGRLWLGIDYGFWCYQRGRFVEILRDGKKPFGSIGDIVEDVDHSIWVNAEDFIYHLKETSIVSKFDIEDPNTIVAAPGGGVFVGTKSAQVFYLHDEKATLLPGLDNKTHLSVMAMHWADGRLWVITNKGLSVWNDGVVHTLSSRNGLEFTLLHTGIRDLQNNEWLMSDRGYIRISHEDIARWLIDPSVQVTPMLLGPADGAQPGMADWSPASYRAPNGDLWFATDKVGQRIVPSEFLQDTRPPHVLIESLIVDGRKYMPKDQLIFPPDSRDVEIQFTAPTFINPRQLRFQYMLEGWDKDWQGGENRRQAFYTNLPPHHYRFRVRACSSSGLWSEEGTTVDFDVQPTWLQLRWIQIALALLSLVAMWLLFRIRLNHARNRLRERLATRLAERERIARDLHDTLLQSTEGLVLRFQAISLCMPVDDPLRSDMENVLSTAGTVMGEGRDRILRLRAGAQEATQFSEVIHGVVAELQRTYPPVHFKFNAVGTLHEVDPAICDEILFIARELLLNAFKHAKATEIELDLEIQKDRLKLIVVDNGIGSGIEQAAHRKANDHFGLMGVQERAAAMKGTISISQAAGKGTLVSLSLPTGKIWKSRDSEFRGKIRNVLHRLFFGRYLANED